MIRLNLVREGGGPIVVLSHALGCDLHMWDGAAALLARAHTVLRYDHRNHGASESMPGPVTMQDLADDAAALVEREAEGEPVHFVGLSMGGMVAQALAARRPGLLKTVVIANSASHYPDAAPWRSRIETVRAQGRRADQGRAAHQGGRRDADVERVPDDGAHAGDERSVVVRRQHRRVRHEPRRAGGVRVAL